MAMVTLPSLLENLWLNSRDRLSSGEKNDPKVTASILNPTPQIWGRPSGELPVTELTIPFPCVRVHIEECSCHRHVGYFLPRKWLMASVVSCGHSYQCHPSSTSGPSDSIKILLHQILSLNSTKWWKFVLKWQPSYHRTYGLMCLDFFHGPIPAVLPSDDLFQIAFRLYPGTPPWKDWRNSRELSWQPLDIIFRMAHGYWVQIYHHYIPI